MFKEIFIVSSESPSGLVYKVSRGRCKAGQAQGYKDKRYWRVKVNGKMYSVHRIIYELIYGKIEGEIDHIDRNGFNNSIDNLRDQTHSQNCFNRDSTNASGYTGVVLKPSGRFEARIKLGGTQKYLGTFDTQLEASEQYQEALQAAISGSI